MARMLQGDAFVKTVYSTRSWFVHTQHTDGQWYVQELSTVSNIIGLIHFFDNWDIEDDENWNNMFDYPRYDNNDNDDTTAPYSLCQVQIDRRCTPRQRWQQCVKFGRWIATDESRVAGWYHSACTIGPNAKPIQMGATLHSINGVRLKRELDGFGAPGYQIFDFKPFIFLLKKDED